MFKAMLLLMLAHLPATEALPPHLLFAAGALESLPFPVAMPAAPEGYDLVDVRLQMLPHARFGRIPSYTLVFAAGEQSFMLQSRPDGYRLSGDQCKAQVLKRSRSFIQPQPSFGPFFSEPYTLELLSPACSAAGQTLSPTTIHPELGERIWSGMQWYLPVALRHRPPQLLSLEEILN